MAYLPTLDPAATQVLNILFDRGNIAGFELMKLAEGTPADKLMGAITTLRRSDLIQVVGNASTERDFQFARFAILPSARGMAHELIRQSS
jgi:hypothetical protein